MIHRAGIVGCGRIGCGFDDDPRRKTVSSHAGAYVQTPNVELVALADLDKDKTRRYGEKFGVDGLYVDYREMLAQEKLDILSICTWSETHREILEQAVRAGVKAIFCEKPIADSLAAADAMIELCAADDVLLIVNHKRRFDPLHQDIAAYLRGGRFGNIQQVTCYYTSGLANTGVHLFDLLRFYFGEVSWVQGLMSRNKSPDPADPNIDGWLWFDSGFLAAVQACDVEHYYILEINVLSTLGRLRIISGTVDELQFEGVRESPYASEYRELYPAAPPIETDRRHEFLLQGVQHLLSCLSAKTSPLCSGQDGRKAIEVICALRESAQNHGRRVVLPLKGQPN